LDIARVRESIDATGLRFSALSQSLRDKRALDRAFLERLFEAFPSGDALAMVEDQESEDEGEEEVFGDDRAPDRYDHVELPKGVNSAVLVRQDLRELLKDQRFNPEGRRLGRLTGAKAGLALAQAQSRVQVIEAEIQVDLANAIETLRDRGDFTEYAEGASPPLADPDLVTVGEQTDYGTVRYFRLFPEEFAALHAKRDERRRVADEGLRAVLGLLGESGTDGAEAR